MPIQITETKIKILEHVARYYVTTRHLIQKIYFPHVTGPRSVNKMLNKLLSEKYMSVASMSLVPNGKHASPVYYPNSKTAQTLRDWYDDEQWLDIFIKSPKASRLYHWIEISYTHYLLEQAVAATDGVSLLTYANEWEPLNKGSAKNRQFTLHSKLRESPPLACQPDAGCLLERKPNRKVFYLEVDRGTSSINRIIQTKPPGYAELLRQERHRKHFPETTVRSFGVLFVTTDISRRDRLIEAIKGRPGDSLWRAASQSDLSPKKFFTAPVWRSPKQDDLVTLLA